MMDPWWKWFYLTITWICIWIFLKVGIFDKVSERVLAALRVRHAGLSLKFVSHFAYISLFILYLGGCFIIWGRSSTVQKVAIWAGSFGIFLTIVTSEIWRRIFSSAAFASSDIVDVADYIKVHHNGEVISGVVIDIGTYFLTLVDFTNERHHFPVSQLLDSTVTNYSFENGENPMAEIKLTIPYLRPDGGFTNLQQIYLILNEILEEDGVKEHLILNGSDKQKPLPYTEMGGSGIEIHLRVWCRGKVSSQQGTVENLFNWWKMPHELSKRIYHRFMSEGLEFELPVRKLITYAPVAKNEVDKKVDEYIGSYREAAAKSEKIEIEEKVKPPKKDEK